MELPATTPFDASPIARMAYLDAYRDGYRSAARGEIASTDFLQGPNRFAKELGWRAGASAAQVQMESRAATTGENERRDTSP